MRPLFASSAFTAHNSTFSKCFSRTMDDGQFPHIQIRIAHSLSLSISEINTSEWHGCLQKHHRCSVSSLMEACACISVIICDIYIRAHVKKKLGQCSKINVIDFTSKNPFTCLAGYYRKAGDFWQAWQE